MDLVISLNVGDIIYRMKNPAPIFNIIEAAYNVTFDVLSGEMPSKKDRRRLQPFNATQESIEQIFEEK